MLTLNQFQRLDAGEPINWKNQLMTGLVARWQVAPGGHPSYKGGPKLRDMRHLNDGTLTTGPTWDGALGRKGGFGSIVCTGGAYVAVPFPAIGTDDSFTLAFWHRPTSWTSAYTAVMDDSSRNWQLDFDTSGNVSFNGNMFGAPVGGEGMAAGSWWHYVHVRNRQTGNGAIYVNGVLIGTFSGGIASYAGGTVYFGQTGGTGTNYDGRYDCICLYHRRALSATEVKQLYDATSRPDDPTLNWLPMGFVNSTAAATTRGMPFETRSTAFNGGRCLAGVIR